MKKDTLSQDTWVMKILELQRGGSILSSSRFAAETPIENLLIKSM